MMIKKILGGLLFLFFLVSLITFMISFTDDYNEKCKLDDFEDWQEMEMDLICGDFGTMYFKLIAIVGLHGIILGIILISFTCSDSKEKEVKCKRMEVKCDCEACKIFDEAVAFNLKCRVERIIRETLRENKNE